MLRWLAQREYAEGCYGGSRTRLKAIADRIDAEHEKAMADAYLSGTPTDEKLTELGWVRLPVDADGEVIHIGDEMEYGRARGRVIALMLSNYPKKWGGWLHWGIQLEGEHAPTALDGFFRHYHVPTVEDVLREFADEVQRCCDTADTIAEYAAKLWLAEEVDG